LVEWRSNHNLPGRDGRSSGQIHGRRDITYDALDSNAAYVDPTTSVYYIDGAPANGVVILDDIHTGQFTYTPNNAFSGVDSFSWDVVDQYGDSNVAIVTVYVGVAAKLERPDMRVATQP
jgi:hypothetical protein